MYKKKTKPNVYVSSSTRSKTKIKEKTLNKCIQKAEERVTIKPLRFKQCDIFCGAGNKPSNR